ncbi:phosphoribosyl-ATP diphosphatase [Pelagibacterium lacus]|uniref:Phosphoribosyl-ATP pyrophosphatase n=1 Tax=Pelagibacterium lacus TaxID=2282655 RepID=A0A369W1I8_9HYPH|nr:phosphoribosyl-ATP diphosphatase [Pelagibacterium lacus]RDE08546.1 phosphoribosyl-ATP diphosphatase [Pelagibacterium lacus]
MTTLTIEALEARLAERATAAPDQSYTAKLLSRGTAKCAQKLGEEAVETVIAAMSGDKDELVKESADLIYHLLVLLRAEGVALDRVLAELDRRTGQSGLAEKAARPKD